MAQHKKILYLSYDGMTDALGESQVIPYLSRLAKEGFEIHIVSFEKPEVFTEQKRKVIESKISGVSITWHPMSYTKRPPVISTLKDLRAGWEKVKELHGKYKFDIVHCRGYITAILGLRLKKKYGCRFIFDMRGWWPDEKKESGIWKGPLFGIVYQYFKKLERDFFRKADVTVSLTYSGKREILRSKLTDERNIGVIPTCVDFNIFKEYSEETRAKVRDELKIPATAKVLVYSGSVGGNYAPEDIFAIFAGYRSLYPGAVLLILSKTDPVLVLDRLPEFKVEEDKVRVISSDFNKVYQYLQASDAGIILYKLDFSVIGRSPTKLGEYWSSGVPVISLKGIGDLDDIIARYPEGGVLIGNPAREEAQQAFTSPVFSNPDKKKLREYAVDYFDIAKGVKFYKEIYQKL